MITFTPDTGDQDDPRIIWNLRNLKPEEKALAEKECLRVAVKINDLNAWENLNFPSKSTIQLENSEWIVTTQIPIDRIQFVRNQPFVKDLMHSVFVEPIEFGQAKTTQNHSSKNNDLMWQ